LRLDGEKVLSPEKALFAGAKSKRCNRSPRAKRQPSSGCVADARCDIRTVAIESTGIHWIGLYQLLADATDVVLLAKKSKYLMFLALDFEVDDRKSTAKLLQA
jgi:hypothetical protein